MKFIKCLLAFFIVFPTFLSITDAKEIDEVYDFPVKLGSDEWNSLTSSQEMFDITQIPENVLNNLTTEALLETCLQYPLIGNIFVYNSTEEGVLKVSEQFNGLKELLNRSDLSEVLENKYNNQMRTKGNNSNIEFMAFQALLAHQSITNNLTSEYEQRIIDDLSMTENTVYLFSLSEATDIKTRDMNGTIKTPRGTSVPVIATSYELTSSEIASIDLQMKYQYPNATKLSNATRRYNCHSYAWYSQSWSNTIWMNNPSAYMSDGSYTKQAGRASGSRIYYATGNHSGILTSSTTVKSKWGQAGLYSHSYNYSPYGTGGLSYWR